MKYAGLISMAIGIIGVIAIIYFNYSVALEYEELGELSEIITLFTYGRTNKMILLTAELVGLIMGLTSILQMKRRIGVLGSVICAVDMIIIFSQS